MAARRAAATWKRSTLEFEARTKDENSNKQTTDVSVDASFFAHRRQKSMTLPASVGKRKHKQHVAAGRPQPGVCTTVTSSSSSGNAAAAFFHKSREFIRKKSE